MPLFWSQEEAGPLHVVSHLCFFTTTKHFKSSFLNCGYRKHPKMISSMSFPCRISNSPHGPSAKFLVQNSELLPSVLQFLSGVDACRGDKLVDVIVSPQFTRWLSSRWQETASKDPGRCSRLILWVVLARRRTELLRPDDNYQKYWGCAAVTQLPWIHPNVPDLLFGCGWIDL